jgi:hypothetical protein
VDDTGSRPDLDASFDAAKAFTPFGPDELAELGLFHQHVADLDKALEEDRDMQMTSASGTSWLDGVDEERVRVVMPPYRKLAMLEKPGTFNRARNLLANHLREGGTEDAATARDMLSVAKDFRKVVLDRGFNLKFIDERDDGTEGVVAPKTVLDWLVNGVVLHSDSEPRARWEKLGGFRSAGNVMCVMVTVGHETYVFGRVDAVVKEVLALSESGAAVPDAGSTTGESS